MCPYNNNFITKINLEHLELLKPWRPQIQLIPGGPRFTEVIIELTNRLLRKALCYSTNELSESLL